jgi:hypothetical protein
MGRVHGNSWVGGVVSGIVAVVVLNRGLETR